MLNALRDGFGGPISNHFVTANIEAIASPNQLHGATKTTCGLLGNTSQ